MTKPVGAGKAKLILYASCALFLLLQGRLWLSDAGWSEVVRLRAGVADQAAENQDRAKLNARLQAEVADLKNGNAALEERARADLGMIGPGESFFLWSPTTASTDANKQ